MLGTNFTIYDNGNNPKKGFNSSADHRRELTAILYVNIFWNFLDGFFIFFLLLLRIRIFWVLKDRGKWLF
jgi:hypothetical protein